MLSRTRPKVQLPLPGPKARAILARDHGVMSPTYHRPYGWVPDRGEGAWVWDVDGNLFLDLMAGIAVNTTGYAHPRIVQAVQEQAARFAHVCFSDFAHESAVRLAERLVQKLGGGYRVYFGNSGTEGIEAAIKLARYHTRRPYFLAFSGSFHGRTLGSLSLTASSSRYREGFGPLLPVYHLPYPNPYRMKDPLDQVLSHLESLFRHLVSPQEVAAVIVEPIQGEGGYIVPPSGFLQALQQAVQPHGILLILDEVQSGVGRTGTFLASEPEGIRPDMVVLAKGLASGYPISALLAREELMTWGPGSQGTTFGGNAVSIAAAHATLDLLEEGLMEQAVQVGARLLHGLREYQKLYPQLGDVRGRGLMIGLEFIHPDGREHPELRDRVMLKAFEQGLLTLSAGPSSLRLAPPLILSFEEAETALEIFGEVFRQALH
jgi:4-aminobutyrate aminotransferase